MARFRFGLNGVLKQRRNSERQQQRRVAEIQSQMQQLQEQLRSLDQSLQQAGTELRTHGLVGRLDLDYLAAHRRYIAAEQRRGMQLVQKIALVQREMETQRQVLAELAKQRKIIEKLREKQFQQWLAELSRREAFEMDEISMQIAHRNLRQHRLDANEIGSVA